MVPAKTLMSSPILKKANDFVTGVEANLGEIANWTIVGTAASEPQPRDIDLIVIFKHEYNYQRWTQYRQAWDRIDQSPKIDAAALRLDQLTSQHSVLSNEWFILYQLYHQADWQRPHPPLISVPVTGGYYWALAQRWRQKARDDLALIHFLSNPMLPKEFPNKAAFLKAVSPTPSLSLTQGLSHALSGEQAQLLSPEEKTEWLRFLAQLK
jgi:hypothetical protein